MYKVHLLQDKSIELLYQKRLNEYLILTPTSENFQEEWENIKGCINKAATEALGTKYKRWKKKGLMIWNETLENVIKEKKQAYQRYLQDKTDESSWDNYID